MINWNNLDTLAAFKELKETPLVDLNKVMSGEAGAERVKTYNIPMAEGLNYNFAAKKVDDTTLKALEKLATEAELSDKFAALYNGEVILGSNDPCTKPHDLNCTTNLSQSTLSIKRWDVDAQWPTGH
jgi:hypothetical protein